MYLEEEARLLPAVPGQRLWVPSCLSCPDMGSSHGQDVKGQRLAMGAEASSPCHEGAGVRGGVMPKIWLPQRSSLDFASWPCRSQPGP